jgi:hypothetical protein
VANELDDTYVYQHAVHTHSRWEVASLKLMRSGVVRVAPQSTARAPRSTDCPSCTRVGVRSGRPKI